MRKLNIFVATDSNPNPKGLANSTIWDRNLIDPLIDLGHEVIRFDYDLRPFSVHANPAYPRDLAWQMEHRPRLEEELLRQVKRRHSCEGIDLFLSYFWDAHATPATIQEIKRLGVATVNWFCNGSFQLQMVEKLAPAYDYSLVPEKFRLPDYRAMGANPVYFQEAANPKFYHPRTVPRDIGVSFVGQCYGDRVNYVAALARAGLPVKIFGPRWTERAQEDASIKEKIRRLPPLLGARNALRRLRGKSVVVREPVPLAVVNPRSGGSSRRVAAGTTSNSAAGSAMARKRSVMECAWRGWLVRRSSLRQESMAMVKRRVAAGMRSIADSARGGVLVYATASRAHPRLPGHRRWFGTSIGEIVRQCQHRGTRIVCVGHSWRVAWLRFLPVAEVRPPRARQGSSPRRC